MFLKTIGEISIMASIILIIILSMKWKKQDREDRVVGSIGVVVFMALGIYLIPLSNRLDQKPVHSTESITDKYQQVPPQHQQASSNSTPPPTQVATKPFDWSTADVTEENVKKALSSGIGAAMAIPVTDQTFRKDAILPDVQGYFVNITVNPGDFWDAKDFVKKSGGSLIAYSEKLFQNPKVYEVSVDVRINASNAKGEKGENEGVFIEWRREQANGIDYKAVLDKMFGDYTIPYQLARQYSISKDLYQKLPDFKLPVENNM